MEAERAIDFLGDDTIEFLDGLLGVAQFGVALFDAELRYLWINDALARQNGMPPREHIGVPFITLFPDLRESFLPMLERVRDDRVTLELELEGPVPGRDGDIGDVHTSLHPIQLGDRIGVVVLVVDTTARVRAEQQLAATAERLEEVLGYQRTALDALQHGLLPRSLPEIAGVELRARYLAAAEVIEVGGDWYDAFEVPGRSLYLCVGDVAGHGVDAVEVMGQLRNAARAWYLDHLDPAEILARLNALVTVGTPGAFATAVVARLDLTGGSVRLAAAGHPPPVCVRATDAVEVLDLPPGPPLGAVTDPVFGGIDIDVGAGDTLVFYTDGLIERRGESLDAGIERLERGLAGTTTVDLDTLMERALTSLQPARHRFDDACLLALRLRST